MFSIRFTRCIWREGCVFVCVRSSGVKLPPAITHQSTSVNIQPWSFTYWQICVFVHLCMNLSGYWLKFETQRWHRLRFQTRIWGSGYNQTVRLVIILVTHYYCYGSQIPTNIEEQLCVALHTLELVCLEHCSNLNCLCWQMHTLIPSYNT